MSLEEKKKSPLLKSRFIIFLGCLVFVALLVFAAAIQFNFELAQCEEAGSQYKEIFWNNTIASTVSFLICFAFIFICFFINNCIIIRKLKKFFIEENVQPKKLPNVSLALLIAVVGAFFTKDYIASNALIYLNAEMFNSSLNRDPLFGLNYGYYLFNRPFFIAVSNFVSGTILGVIVYSLGYYVLAFGAIFDAIEIKSLKKHGVVLHSLVNVLIFFALEIASYKFTCENILYSNNGKFFGADFTQVNVWLKVYTVAPFVLSVIVIVAFIMLLRNKFKYAAYTALMFPAYLLIGAIIATVVQLVWVMPYESTRQKPYVKNNMELTKFAYNISYKLDVKDYDISDSLTQQELDKNKETISNFGIVKPSLALDSANQLQSMRSYYKFDDADVANYNINGKPTAVYISAREINTKGLDEKSYENLKFKYTHGYGIVMSPVSYLKSDGRPDYIIKDMPLKSMDTAPKVTRPEIYFGKSTKNHVVVNVKNEKEVDYPDVDTNEETVYSGKAGIRLTPFNRIMSAIKLADPMLLFSSKINSDSKVLINRDIVARIKLVAPFLEVTKDDAYTIINKEGKLLWVVDAYTTSNYFPYSQRISLTPKKKINYIRNSVKVIVDAYDGTMQFYITDTLDPIVMTYKKMYPSLFEKGQIPSDISQYIKYPKRLLSIQANILKKYHLTDETAFFNSKEVWEVPAASDQSGKAVDMDPYYTLMKLPESKNMELDLLLPFIDGDNSNMTGLIVARPDVYSKIILYRFPTSRLIYGPNQLEVDMDKEVEISKVFNFWRQGGDTIQNSDVLVLPVQDEKDKALLFVKPVYVSKDESMLTELRKVVMGYQGRIVMDDTMDKALQKLLLLGPYQEALPPELSGNQALIENLLKVYDEMKAYSASNDWENYGRKMSELDKIISEISKRKDSIF